MITVGFVALILPIALLGAGGGVTVFLRRRYVQITVVGTSMEPTYHDRDRVLVRRGTAFLRRGDVVVVEMPMVAVGSATGVRRKEVAWADEFPATGPNGTARFPRTWMIKRIVAMAGDELPAVVRGSGSSGVGLVPKGSIVVLGDNPACSTDSRRFGSLPLERVLGKVVSSLENGRQSKFVSAEDEGVALG